MFALGGTRCDESAVAVSKIVGVFKDPDADVRSWAIFGLRVQGDAGTPEVRNTLAAAAQ